MTTTFTLLGTGTGPGLPSFFCECKACREVRNNPRLERTRSGAFIDTGADKILIDTPPDLRRQLVREGIRQINTVFLTHWHYDHFGGIGELEYYVKLARKEPIELFLPRNAVTEFLSAFPNLSDVFQVEPWQFGRAYRYGDLKITPLPANHGIEAAGFLVETPNKRLAYFPDTAGLPDFSEQQVTGADWLVCDATFNGENWFPDAHMTIEEAIALGQKVKARYTVLTHLSIHYSQPVTSEELRQKTAQHQGASAGFDGMQLEL